MSRATVNVRWLAERQWQLEDLEDVAQALDVSVQSLLEYTARDSNPEPADWSDAVVIPLFSRAA